MSKIKGSVFGGFQILEGFLDVFCGIMIVLGEDIDSWVFPIVLFVIGAAQIVFGMIDAIKDKEHNIRSSVFVIIFEILGVILVTTLYIVIRPIINEDAALLHQMKWFYIWTLGIFVLSLIQSIDVYSKREKDEEEDDEEDEDDETVNPTPYSARVHSQNRTAVSRTVPPPPMRVCQKCYTIIQQEGEFCPHCGSRTRS